MNKVEILKSVTACILSLLLAFPPTALAQQTEAAAPEQNTAQVFRPEELDSMLAPIALYPDALLAQVLTAATYPVDIVGADRFVKEHPGLKGQALIDAAKDKEWAPSVKAMLQFPDVLAMMDNQLDWTTKLGDAFLAQQRDVMDSVQRLRQKAYEQGKLATGKEQVVTADPQTQTIIIEPASPEIVYVPVYDPMVVYGPWWYPDYPPFYCYYPGFVSGFFLGAFFVSFGWGWRSWDCDWHHHNINVNINNFNNFTTHSFASPSRFQINAAGRSTVTWQHNAQFRRGTAYRDYSTAQRFAGRQASNVAARQNVSNFRGFEQSGAIQSVSMTSTAVSGNMKTSVSKTASGSALSSRSVARTSTASKPAAVTSNAAVKGSAVSQPAARSSVKETSHGGGGFTAFSGAGSGASERAASFRGNSSFQSIRSSSGVSSSHAGGGGISHGGGGVSHGGGAASHGGGGGHR